MPGSYHETRKVALNSAAVVAFILLAVLLTVVFTGISLNMWLAAGIALLIFALSYLVSFRFIDNFIYKKIRLIYKAIPGFKSRVESKSTSNNVQTGSIEGIREAVIEWSARQKLEIEELRKMAAYRREFLGNISHELKTPIFNIQGYVLTLLDGGLEDPNINKDYLLRTEKSINRLIAIVEDLEEISKLESGELKLNLISFDIAELARDVAEFLEMKARKNNAVITISNELQRPLMVYADKKRIRQVLINLIENAVKYGDKPENQILVRFFDMDEHYLIEVKDNGPGIPEESLPRIFERFYRTDKGRSRDHGGSGLGLAIVKHIIEAHGQSIRVRSKLGKGTVFAFTLPKKG
ncbi:MAG: sensor histidine kinase [Bacteroidetes bacterium]|nr:sensor histidine kinase [Bacteroidota bacterium]